MVEAEQTAGTDQMEQELHERQTALEDALERWHQDMDREEHTTDFEENKRNLVALKGRRVVLLQEEQSVRRGLREIRRRHDTSKNGVWRWRRPSKAAGG